MKNAENIRRLGASFLLACAAATWTRDAVSVSCAPPLKFTVNSTADDPDGGLNCVCSTAKGGICTLRAALQEAAAVAVNGAVTIAFDGITMPPIFAPSGGFAVAPSGSSSKTITVDGTTAPSGSIVVDALNSGPVFTFNGATPVPIILKGIVIQGGNNTVGSGGGIASNTPLTVEQCVVRDNQAAIGGGGISAQGSLTILNSTIANNSATTASGNHGGGGVLAFQTLDVQDSTISQNIDHTGIGGGGLSLASSVSSALVARSTLDGNSSQGPSGFGGAIQCAGTGATLSVEGAHFDANSAGSGGAISCQSPITIADSIFSGNEASSSSQGFGGAVLAASAIVTRSVFASNSASRSGGAVALANSTVSNTTFFDNGATSSGGGAVYGYGDVTLNNCTLVQNTAPSGAAIEQRAGSLTLNNTALFGNTASAGSSISAPSGVVSNGHNFIDAPSGFAFAPGSPGTDIMGSEVSPFESPSLVNGALFPASGGVLLDAGDQGLCATYQANIDQVGQPRTVGVRCDIGAVEALQADLGVVLDIAPSTVVVDSPATLSIVVTNNGPSPATNVVVAPMFPANVAATGSIGPLATLAPNTSTTITLSLQPQSVGNYPLSVSVSASQSDRVPSNNEASAVLEAIAPSGAGTADIRLTIAPRPDWVILNEAFTFAFDVKNFGPNDADPVTVQQALPEGVTLQSVQNSQGSCSITAPGTLDCNLGAIASGQTVSVSVTAVAQQAGLFTLSAVAQAPQDTSENNNTSSQTLIAGGELTLTPAHASNPGCSAGGGWLNDIFGTFFCLFSLLVRRLRSSNGTRARG